MKKQRKLMVKKVIKTILSASLALVLAMGFAFSPALSVSAAESLPLNVEKTFLWGDGETENATFSVEQSGFYKITFNDNRQTGNLQISVRKADTGERIYYKYVSVGNEPFVADEIYLKASYQYEITLFYYYKDDLVGGEVKVKLTKSDFMPMDIYRGPISLSTSAIQFDGNDNYKYLKFRADSTSDYVIDYTGDLHAYIYAYDILSGEMVGQDTEYFDTNEWLTRKKVVLHFEANKTYFIMVQNYGDALTSKFAISSLGKTVEDVAIYGTAYDIDSWAVINENSFIYTVEYTDHSTQNMTYTEMCLAGLLPVEIYYNNYVYEVNQESINTAGKNLIILSYNGGWDEYYIDIPSINDYLIEQGYDAAENESEWVVSKQDGDQTWYSRINVSKTGVYSLFSENWDGFDSSFAILDSKNIPVEYNESAEGWPLVAGEDYVLSFRLSFYDANISSAIYELGLVSETIFADVDLSAWYGKAVAYAVGRGIMKGYENGNFGTADGIQRQDFLVMLARYDGISPEDYAGCVPEFSDVQEGSYYDWAVAWGQENGIVTGYEDGRFGVGDYITREQIVTFLCRYARYIGLDTESELNDYVRISATYSDYSDVSAFARDSVVWAISNGAINGKTSSTIVPQGNAQRCEVAQIMYNIFKNEVF